MKCLDNRVKQIVEDAREYLSRNKDDKYLIDPKNFMLILGKADGKYTLNERQIKGTRKHVESYCHYVIYEGIRFVTVTFEEIRIEI